MFKGSAKKPLISTVVVVCGLPPARTWPTPATLRPSKVCLSDGPTDPSRRSLGVQRPAKKPLSMDPIGDINQPRRLRWSFTRTKCPRRSLPSAQKRATSVIISYVLSRPLKTLLGCVYVQLLTYEDVTVCISLTWSSRMHTNVQLKNALAHMCSCFFSYEDVSISIFCRMRLMSVSRTFPLLWPKRMFLHNFWHTRQRFWKIVSIDRHVFTQVLRLITTDHEE